MRAIALFFLLFVLGCGSGGSDCDPSGTWLVTFERGEGDCFPVGSSSAEPLVIENAGDGVAVYYSDGSEPDVIRFDRDACRLSLMFTTYVPETAETYETIGSGNTTLDFDGDELAGDGTLEAVTVIDGIENQCSQVYAIDGYR